MLKQHIRFGLLLSFLMTVMIPTAAQFTDADIVDFFGDCDSATVDYFSGASFVRVRMTNVDTGDTLSFTEEDPNDIVTVSFVPALTDGTVVQVEVGQEFFDSAQITVNCVEPIVEAESGTPDLPFLELCNDGRTNSNMCEPIAIYPVSLAEGTGIDIWDARRTGSRGQLLYVDADDLQTLPETACVIGTSPDSFAQVAWFGDVLVIIAGPDDENKTFIFIYENGFPSQPEVTTIYGLPALNLPNCSR